MAYAQSSMVTDLQLTADLQPVHAHCPPDSLIRQVSHKQSAAIRAVLTVLSVLRRGRCPLGNGTMPCPVGNRVLSVPCYLVPLEFV